MRKTSREEKAKSRKKRQKLPTLTPGETLAMVTGAARKILQDHDDLGEATVGMSGIQVTLKRKQ